MTDWGFPFIFLRDALATHLSGATWNWDGTARMVLLRVSPRFFFVTCFRFELARPGSLEECSGCSAGWRILPRFRFKLDGAFERWGAL